MEQSYQFNFKLGNAHICIANSFLKHHQFPFIILSSNYTLTQKSHKVIVFSTGKKFLRFFKQFHGEKQTLKARIKILHQNKQNPKPRLINFLNYTPSQKKIQNSQNLQNQVERESQTEPIKERGD